MKRHTATRRDIWNPQSPWVALAVLLTAAGVGSGQAGCGHARTVGDPNDPSAASNSSPPSDKKAAEGRTTAAGSGKMASREVGRADRPLVGDSREGAPPLATSPAGLMKPNAVEKIQEKLAKDGHLQKHDKGKLDQATREALRGFQREHNLPATGLPDDVTVQKLGLGPDELFRAAKDAGASK